ncbi:MAG: heparinase II/III family protein [Thermoguttaceae bacterium]|nr:heparinase II/III family protein [Thermoguttaceae bacterium]
MRANESERRRAFQKNVNADLNASQGKRRNGKSWRRVAALGVAAAVAWGASTSGLEWNDVFSTTAAFAADAKKTEPSTAKGFAEVSQAEIDAAFEKLRPAPRLLLTDEALADVKKKVDADPRWKAYLDALKRRADKTLNAPPVERKLEGKRLLGVSREALRRLFGWTFMYRYTGDVKYAARVEKEAVAIAEFSDWNPSHFLDVAEMTTALALAYDSCGETFSSENRKKVREAIRDKGVEEALKIRGWWKRNNANWNQVCWCGTLYGALAIADDEPELARDAVRQAVNGVTWSMASYEPDGNYTEGPGYWGYGTGFNVLLLAALNSALNNDFGRSKARGFAETIRYYEHVFGTTGDAFNYPDSGGGKMFEPTAFWNARNLGDVGVAWNENFQLDAAYVATKHKVKYGTRSIDTIAAHRLGVCALLWGPIRETPLDLAKIDAGKPVDPSEYEFGNVAPKELGYVGVGDGRNAVALFRTAWKRDAAYLGIKAGAPNAPHGHMDEGGFVYDDGGVRWIVELGPENYHRIESRGMNLWGMNQSSERWKLLRYNNFGHSVLTLNGAPQLVDGTTKIVETKIGSSGEASSATIDLTPVYRGEAKSVKRVATLNPDGSLIVEDVVEALADREIKVERRLLTPAAVEIVSERVAKLTAPSPVHCGDATLCKTVETQSEIPSSFSVVAAETENDFDSKNPGVSILIETATVEAGKTATFRTVFSPVERTEKSGGEKK